MYGTDAADLATYLLGLVTGASPDGTDPLAAWRVAQFAARPARTCVADLPPLTVAEVCDAAEDTVAAMWPQGDAFDLPDGDECFRTGDDANRLLNLLAVIHRDGGHHTAAVGVAQSCCDAAARVLAAYHAGDAPAPRGFRDDETPDPQVIAANARAEMDRLAADDAALASAWGDVERAALALVRREGATAQPDALDADDAREVLTSAARALIDGLGLAAAPDVVALQLDEHVGNLLARITRLTAERDARERRAAEAGSLDLDAIEARADYMSAEDGAALLALLARVRELEAQPRPAAQPAPLDFYGALAAVRNGRFVPSPRCPQCDGVRRIDDARGNTVPCPSCVPRSCVVCSADWPLDRRDCPGCGHPDRDAGAVTNNDRAQLAALAGARFAEEHPYAAGAIMGGIAHRSEVDSGQ